ncbi:hypothetical protein ACFQ0D_05970, partial [Micromonospora zhanjiangensis]
FGPATVPAGRSSTLVLRAAPGAQCGGYRITVAGTAGTLVRTAALTLSVTGRCVTRTVAGWSGVAET